jgi:glycine cleavage system H lipoate-binding protein
MQAGVVGKKDCYSHYNCPECRFDRVMQSIADQNKRMMQAGEKPKGRKGAIVSWKDKLKLLPANKRPCIHHLKGRIGFKPCLQDYRCGNCEFDQFFDDQYSVHAVVCPVDFLEIKGIRVPQGYYFHYGHTWVRMENSDEVRVGIDDFALRLLGPLDKILSPLFGKTLEQGRAEIKVIRGEHEAEFLSPVNGVVTAMNNSLREMGSLANKNPYQDGWVMRVKSDDLRDDLKGLMLHNETKAFIGAEVDRLQVLMGQAGAAVAADGGYPGYDIFGNLPQLGWDKLVKEFLR